MSVNHSAKSGGIKGISFSIFFNEGMFCVLIIQISTLKIPFSV